MLVAVAVVLSGCATGDGDDQGATTTSPAAAEAPASPWDVPLEQRPALFDPCEEIPIEAIEEAIGGQVERDEDIHHHRPEELYTCSWSNDEVRFIMTGTWMSRQEFVGDQKFETLDSGAVVHGRSSLWLAPKVGSERDDCFHVFFTERGAVVGHMSLKTSLREFQGQRISRACDVYESTIEPLIGYLPEGDF